MKIEKIVSMNIILKRNIGIKKKVGNIKIKYISVFVIMIQILLT